MSSGGRLEMFHGSKKITNSDNNVDLIMFVMC